MKHPYTLTATCFDTRTEIRTVGREMDSSERSELTEAMREMNPDAPIGELTDNSGIVVVLSTRDTESLLEEAYDYLRITAAIARVSDTYHPEATTNETSLLASRAVPSAPYTVTVERSGLAPIVEEADTRERAEEIARWHCAVCAEATWVTIRRSEVLYSAEAAIFRN